MDLLKVKESTFKKKNIFVEYKKYKYFFMMLIPVVAYYSLFAYVPMYGMLMAFQDFQPLKGIWGSTWVGGGNFSKLFSGLYFLPVLKNTLIISFYKLLFGFPAPIILCLIFNEIRSKNFKKIAQSITYLPHFISWVVLSGMVIEILSPSRGVVNYVIQLLGGESVFFIAEPKYFRGILVVSSIWREIGWQSIIFLAAVTNIDPEMYDVADIDGAGRFSKILNITLPSIMPVIIIMFIFAVGNIINDDFEQVYNLLNAKVMSVGDVISTYTYREGLENMNYSYATAVGVFKNVVSFSFVIGANYIAKRVSDYSIW